MPFYIFTPSTQRLSREIENGFYDQKFILSTFSEYQNMLSSLFSRTSLVITEFTPGSVVIVASVSCNKLRQMRSLKAVSRCSNSSPFEVHMKKNPLVQIYHIRLEWLSTKKRRCALPWRHRYYLLLLLMIDC